MGAAATAYAAGTGFFWCAARQVSLQPSEGTAVGAPSGLAVDGEVVTKALSRQITSKHLATLTGLEPGTTYVVDVRGMNQADGALQVLGGAGWLGRQLPAGGVYLAGWL